jgi:hypothetical protein
MDRNPNTRRPNLKLIGALTLSPRWKRRWEQLTGVGLHGVKTVDQLEAYVNVCKLRSKDIEDDAEKRWLFSQMDVYFELCPGKEIAPSPCDPPPKPKAASVEQHGQLTSHVGGREAMERELLRLIIEDQTDTPRGHELRALLTKEASPNLQLLDGGEGIESPRGRPRVSRRRVSHRPHLTAHARSRI